MTIEEVREERRALEAENILLVARANELTDELRRIEAALRENVERTHRLRQACAHPNGDRRSPHSETYGTDVVSCPDCGFNRPQSDF